VPNGWHICALTAAGIAMGLGELVFCLAVLVAGCIGAGFAIDGLRTLAFIAIVFGNQATTYNIRERRQLRSSWPSAWLAVASVADIAIASTLAIGGFAMMALPIWMVAATLAAAALAAVLLDLIKRPVYARLGIV
jgi:H+-transporting ATPase